MIPASPHYSFLPFHPCSFHFSNAVFVTTLFTKSFLILRWSHSITQYPPPTPHRTNKETRSQMQLRLKLQKKLELSKGEMRTLPEKDTRKATQMGKQSTLVAVTSASGHVKGWMVEDLMCHN